MATGRAEHRRDRRRPRAMWAAWGFVGARGGRVARLVWRCGRAWLVAATPARPPAAHPRARHVPTRPAENIF